MNLILVAVSSGCYSAGVGRVEEDVEFNRFFGFIFSTRAGRRWRPLVSCGLRLLRVSWTLLVYQML